MTRQLIPVFEMRHSFPFFLFMLFVPFVVHAFPATHIQDDPEAEQPKRETPVLPEGLGDEAQEDDEEDEDGSSGGPALPQGLGSGEQEERSRDDGPPVPAGLGDDGEAGESAGQPASNGSPPGDFLAGITGFWDTRAGIRVRDDPNQRTTLLGETRLQLSRDQHAGGALFRVTADLIYDNVADGHNLQPEQGRGWLDLREAYLATPLGESMDVRAGRQVLTWGVGDLLFLNDLFPKDWNSFFAGRDVEYLKAPSDAVRVALFGDVLNLDVVYTPKFDPDRFLDNRRLSFFDPRFGRVVGDDVEVRPQRPDDWFGDDEWAFRLHRMLGAWEVAGYGYRGFWKSPEGFDPAIGRPLFPRERLNNPARSAFLWEKPQIVWCEPSDSSRSYGRGSQRARCGFSGETRLGRAFAGAPPRLDSLIWNDQTALAQAEPEHPAKAPSRPRRVVQTFPSLSAWGGSIRGPLHTGILSAETSWYRSRDDLSGTDPFLPNSQFRFLVGYEQEIVPDFMLGAQYYLERTLDFDALERNQPPGFAAPDENRHLFTLRATLLTHSQNVTWSLFTFASPSDEDVYLRGSWEWKATDAWYLTVGFNLFEGRDRDSFFGQFESNSNAYLGVRYGF